MAATDDRLFSLIAPLVTGFHSQSMLFDIEGRTGALTARGPFTTAFEATQIEVEPGHHFVYVQMLGTGPLPNVQTLRIDADAVVEIDRKRADRECPSAMDPRGDFLWMGSNTYDIRSGNGIPVPVESFPAGRALAVHPFLDRVYRVDGGRLDVFDLDRASGRSTLAFAVGAPAAPVGAAIDPFGRFP